MLKLLTTIVVTATIYHADPAQCRIAVSRDLEKHGFVFGTKVCVENAGGFDGVWTVEDRMNKRWKNRIDFLVNKDVKGGKWNKVKLTIIYE